MDRQILATIFSVLMLFYLGAKPIQASQVAGSSALLKNEFIKDSRITKLEHFLQAYNSPLVDYTEDFIQSADKYQIDWKLVPAITGVESSFGKRIPPGSYNAYGWANGTYYFQSWEDSINHVSQVLKEKYIDRGLDTPYKMGPVYAPPSPTWAGKVTYFMEKIDCSGQENCLDNLGLTL